VVTSGGASGHISVSASDLGDLRKGGCAFPVSNDTVASPVGDRHAVSKILAALAH
jgi:hypothetical protein